MHTGDLAVMDEDGYLNIVGRIKDVTEVEEFLRTHPASSTCR